MEIKSLDTVNFSALMDCFLIAFENYFVNMPTDHEYYKERWEMAGVNLGLSYGMFADDTLVGFIINAIDKRNEKWIAFNTGTGVLPEYRGQRIVKSIYQYAIPKLQENGVTECRLEVIKDNIKAIKAYEGIGFTITKSYKCYNGNIILKDTIDDFELKKVNQSYFDWKTLHQSKYSWDNHFNVIAKGKYAYYSVMLNGNRDSYFVINSDNGYIAQFNTLSNTPNSWNRLFAAIQQISKTIKINNVDETLTQKVDFLNTIGLNNTIDQYEMALSL